MRCPCRKISEGVDYASCCEPAHTDVVTAASAERLMRARYAAFALGLADFLSRTWHPSTRPADLVLEPGQTWLSLKIIASEEAGDRATVRFVARSKLAGRSHTLTETSRFERVGERWYYVDGDTEAT